MTEPSEVRPEWEERIKAKVMNGAGQLGPDDFSDVLDLYLAYVVMRARVAGHEEFERGQLARLLEPTEGEP